MSVIQLIFASLDLSYSVFKEIRVSPKMTLPAGTLSRTLDFASLPSHVNLAECDKQDW